MTREDKIEIALFGFQSLAAIAMVAIVAGVVIYYPVEAVTLLAIWSILSIIVKFIIGIHKISKGG